MDRAALPVEVGTLRIRADERVLVLELELVGLASRELLEIRYPEVRRPRSEGVGEGQRADRRIAAGAATRDQESIGIRLTLVDEVASRVDAIGEVDHSPHSVETLP